MPPAILKVDKDRIGLNAGFTIHDRNIKINYYPILRIGYYAAYPILSCIM